MSQSAPPPAEHPSGNPSVGSTVAPAAVARPVWGRPLFWLGALLWVAVGFGVWRMGFVPPAGQDQVRENKPGSGPDAPSGQTAAAHGVPLPTQIDQAGNLVVDPMQLLGGADGQQGIPAPTTAVPYWDPSGIQDFSLISATGEPVTRNSLLGKPFVISFIFTHCVGPCPRVTQRMRELQDRTKQADFRLVTVSVDPQRDTPEVLTRYAKQNGADPARWLFLTGDENTIYGLVRDSFRKVVERATEPVPAGEEITHTTSLLLVDGRGVVRSQYDTRFDNEMISLRKDATLLAQGGELPADLGSVRGPASGVLVEAGTEPGASSKQADAAVLGATSAGNEPAADQRTAPDWVMLLPRINATLNGLCTILLTVGYILIRRGQREAHKRVMLSAFGVSVAFLICYLTYHQLLYAYTGLHGQSFQGSGSARLLYLIILITHVTLAAMVPFLALATIYRGLKGQLAQHRAIARITFPIWMYVSVTGVVIYLMLYHWPVGV